MKIVIFILLISNLLISCINADQNNKLKEPVMQTSQITVSVDSLLENPEKFADQQVSVSGLAAHVCKHGGQKLFMVGTMPEKYLRINTGKNIAEFPIDLEGSTIEVRGIVTRFEEELPAENETNSDAVSESDTSRLEKAYHKDNFYVVVAESYVVNE